MHFQRNEVINIYTINLFKKCNLIMRWGDVYWGIKQYILDIKSVSKFAEEFIMNNPQTSIEEIYELEWEIDDRELVLDLINRILKKLPAQDDQSNDIIKRRWRYCIVKILREREINNSVLLDKMEIVYADFNYPTEMSGFIKYMSPDDDYNPSNYSIEENEQRMIDKIDDFIKSERSNIIS